MSLGVMPHARSHPVVPSLQVPDAAPYWALFLDVDGTLLDIAPRPDEVRVAPGLPQLLERVRRGLGGALTLVSGRPIAELDRLFDPLALPAGGQHGLERRTAEGDHLRVAVDRAALDRIRRALQAFVAETPGTELEDKALSVALHYRQAPAREAEARALVQRLIAPYEHAFHVQEGKMVLEIKPRGTHKGTVVETFLGEPPFIGRRPVFVGDDVTDEDGFRAANLFGGLSIQIGHREPTDARYRIGSVAEFHAWLARQADRLDPGIPAS